MKSLKKIFSMYNLKKNSIICIIISLVFSLVSLMYPKLYGMFIFNLENNISVNTILLLYLGIICFSFVFQFLIGLVFGKVYSKLDTTLRHGLYQSFSMHSEKKIKTMGQAYYENIMDTSVHSILGLFFPAIMEKIMGVGKYIIILIILFNYSYVFGILGLCALCLYIVAYFVNKKFYSPMFLETMKKFANMHSSIVEAFSMTTLIRSFPFLKTNLDEQIKNKIIDTNEKSRKTDLFSDTIYRLVPLYVLPILSVFLMFVCTKMYVSNLLDISAIVTIIAYFSQLTSILGDLDAVSQSYFSACEAADEILSLLEDEMSVEKLDIKNKNIDFFYYVAHLDLPLGENRHVHIKNLTIEADKTHALLGMSGSGKSSFLCSLLGYEKPQGAIFVFNKDTTPYNYYLENKVLFISQNSYILNADIIQNIELGLYIPERTEKILKLLNLEYLKNRILGVDGQHISGGEKRLINIARIFFHAHNYKYLILDEIFTSVDIITKNKIFPLLKNVLNDKTCIIVSHDPNEINFLCDNIISIEKDGTVFSGTLEEAKCKSDFLKNITELQSSN